MNAFLHRELAQVEADEKRRSAAAGARGRAPRRPWSAAILSLLRRSRSADTENPLGDAEVRIRYAGAEDVDTVARLAALDDAAIPASPVLLVEVDGEPWAARSLVTDQVIANPFRRTSMLAELLAVRAAQVRAAAGALDGRLVPRRAAPRV
jgi:hypothetical protein